MNFNLVLAIELVRFFLGSLEEVVLGVAWNQSSLKKSEKNINTFSLGYDSGDSNKCDSKTQQDSTLSQLLNTLVEEIGCSCIRNMSDFMFAASSGPKTQYDTITDTKGRLLVKGRTACIEY